MLNVATAYGSVSLAESSIRKGTLVITVRQTEPSGKFVQHVAQCNLSRNQARELANHLVLLADKLAFEGLNESLNKSGA